MGNLLNLLTDRTLSPKYDVFLDFESKRNNWFMLVIDVVAYKEMNLTSILK